MPEAKDRFMAFQFWVTVGTHHGTGVDGGFTDVTGLAAETEVETFRMGGQNNAEVALPGPTKFPSRLVLKRGLGDATMLWKWYSSVLRGEIKREDITIELRSAEEAAKRHGQQGASWTFSDACPVKWTGPELHAGTSAVSFETIELVHRGFKEPNN
jgi:phage tail-like protein